MMRVVTSAGMRAADRWTIEHVYSEEALMHAAGLGVARAVRRLLRDRGSWPGRVLVACGRGNNGGDGLSAARFLSDWGASVDVCLYGGATGLSESSQRQLSALGTCGIPVDVAPSPDVVAVRERAAQADVALDALLGTGAKGAPRPPLNEVVRGLASAACPVVAVDLPSGLDADTGVALGPAVDATLTVCLAAAKLGCLTGPDHHLAGRVVVAEIGIPAAAYGSATAAPTPAALALEAADVAPLVPARPRGAHKGKFGHVLLVAGSPGFSGAAALAARAALRAGCGLVSVVTPESVWPMVAQTAPAAMVHPAPAAGDGRLDKQSLAVCEPLLERADVLVVGPGLGRSPGTAELVAALAHRWRGPLVLDADAVAQAPAALGAEHRPVALTPHAGELGALLGESPKSLESDRLGALRRAVEQTGAMVVYKGAGTLIGAPDGRIWVNRTGNAGMATAGTGDVLAGFAGGLWAQAAAGHADTAAAEAGKGRTAGGHIGGWAPRLAAAVWLHGRAGDLAAARVGEYALTSVDLADALGDALQEVTD